MGHRLTWTPEATQRPASHAVKGRHPEVVDTSPTKGHYISNVLGPVAARANRRPAHLAPRQRTTRQTRDRRGIELLRGAWGAVLLAAPDRILSSIHGLYNDTKSRVITRILGARHLTQAALSERRPGAEVLAMGRWADTVHALTALTLAVGDRDRARARAGLTDSVVAGLWATAGYHDLTRARATPPPDRRRRERLAVLVLTHARAEASCAAESTKIAESKPC